MFTKFLEYPIHSTLVDKLIWKGNQVLSPFNGQTVFVNVQVQAENESQVVEEEIKSDANGRKERKSRFLVYFYFI